MSKKFSILMSLLIFSLATFSNNVAASDNITTNYDSTQQSTIELLDNGDYLETIIETDNAVDSSIISTQSTTKYTTGTKTTYYKNKNGIVLWSVSIKGTFSYNGSTSKCTSCSHSTTAPSSAWSIVSSSSSKSGNTATAHATAAQREGSLIVVTVEKSVTLKCSATGVLS